MSFVLYMLCILCFILKIDMLYIIVKVKNLNSLINQNYN